MENIQKVILIIHTLIALAIIGLVLLQRGKGADAGAGFGAGASGTVFGARGSGSFFSRMTAILATAFFASSLTLAYLSSQRAEAPDSLLESVPAVQDDAPADEVPDLPGDQPDADMPVLEDAARELIDEADMPALDDDLPATDEGQ